MNGSVTSSKIHRQPIFFMQQYINRPPSFGGLAQHCSTKSALTSTEPSAQNEEHETNPTNWNTIYHFPSIMLTASLKRLKFYPMVFTGISVPVSIGMAYFNIWSMTTAEIVGAIGLTTSLTFSLFGLITDNLVGFVYCDDRLSKVKISFLDTKGKRQNRIYSVDDLVSRTELPRSFLKLYFPVKNHENSDVYKLVHQYGEIYDIHAFNKIFGREIDTKQSAAAQCIVPVARMSQYGPHFIEPIVSREKIEELQSTGELSKISHVPIKAALSNQNCSVFYDPLVSQFTNYVMKQGNKQLARELVEKGFENIKRLQLERYHLSESDEEKAKLELNPRKLLHMAVENCRPMLQLTPIKRGGVRYQVPVPITEKRSYFIAMKWLLEAIREKERTVHFPEKMAWEILDAAANQGKVVKRKHELHRQCEANRAYAHYRWS
uniref:Small ribosomal subunit protein uS7m n=1 Tax=Anopheles culicifacies TaxID=139723 RepID=A0A182MM93_9DIPT